MDTDKKTQKDKPRTVIRKTAIALLVIVCVVVFVTILFRVLKKLESAGQGSISKGSSVSGSIKTYYQPVDPFGPSIPTTYTYPGGTGSGSKIQGTQLCQLYTYENLFSNGEQGTTLDVVTNTKPNINNVFIDYVNGFNHTGGDFKCVSADQIEAINVSQECLGSEQANIYNVCYKKDGGVVEKGTSYSFPTQCSTLPVCDGILGIMTLNFKLSGTKLDTDVMCLGVSTISVPPDVYSSNTFAYYRELGILNSDTGLQKGTSVYPVTLTSLQCNTKSAVQKFLLTSYSYGSHIPKSETGQKTQEEIVGFYQSKTTGIYQSIIYKPFDAYLDVDTENSNSSETKFVLKKLQTPLKSSETSSPESVKWILFPSLNQSSSRYPSSQRCNFIQSEKLNDRYSMIATEVPAGSEFIKSTFDLEVTKNVGDFLRYGNLKYLSVGPTYCSYKNTVYPDYVFRNLTPGCTLNPFLFYDYNILSKELNQPNQSDVNHFILESSSDPLTFNYGERFLDGSCNLEVVDYEKFIVEFPGEYFTNTEGAISDFAVNDINKDIIDSGMYIESGSGLISEVVVSEPPKQKDKTKKAQYISGVYQNISPVSQTDSSGGTTPGSGAIFTITVSSILNVSTGYNSPNVTAEVTQGGLNYELKDLLTFNSSNIGMSLFTNPVFEVSATYKQPYIFRAVPMNSSGVLSKDPLKAGQQDNFPTRDFSLLATFDNVNGLVPLTSTFSESILSSGFNYELDSTVYMIQLDTVTGSYGTSQTGDAVIDNLSKNPQDLKGFITIKPVSVTDGNYSGRAPAPFSLLPDGSTIPKFNFLGNSLMKLDKSKPQLVYGGETYLGTSTLIETFASTGIKDVKGIENFFASEKSGGLETDVTFLKSLQYKDIKYVTTEGEISVNGVSQIILGKYIPYASFTPMTGSDIPAQTVGTEIYNSNTFSFIPYGQDNIYDTSFLTGYNN